MVWPPVQLMLLLVVLEQATVEDLLALPVAIPVAVERLAEERPASVSELLSVSACQMRWISWSMMGFCRSMEAVTIAMVSVNTCVHAHGPYLPAVESCSPWGTACRGKR